MLHLTRYCPGSDRGASKQQPNLQRSTTQGVPKEQKIEMQNGKCKDAKQKSKMDSAQTSNFCILVCHFDF
jgi:hypothetical protein